MNSDNKQGVQIERGPAFSWLTEGEGSKGYRGERETDRQELLQLAISEAIYRGFEALIEALYTMHDNRR